MRHRPFIVLFEQCCAITEGRGWTTCNSYRTGGVHVLTSQCAGWCERSNALPQFVARPLPGAATAELPRPGVRGPVTTSPETPPKQSSHGDYGAKNRIPLPLLRRSQISFATFSLQLPNLPCLRRSSVPRDIRAESRPPHVPSNSTQADRYTAAAKCYIGVAGQRCRASRGSC